MLIAISIKNWKSFKNQVSFTMEAGREKNHSETVVKLKKFRLNLLPIAAIFGPNASGKSNFVKAFSFLQNLIVDPNRVFLSTEPFGFRLDPETKNQPTELGVDLWLNDSVYSYSLVLNKQKILNERLSFKNTSSEKILFQREGAELTPGKLLKKEVSTDSIKFITPFLQKNYTALSLLGEAKIKKILPVYNWFRDSLRIITPDSISITKFEKNAEDDLSDLGTGICSIKATPFSEELPEDIRRLSSDLPSGSVLNVRDPRLGALRISREDENRGIKVEKLMAVHKNTQGDEELFSFTDESDGSLRLFDLKPAFDKLNSANETLTYVIDELDRSLHTKLTSHLIARYTEECNEDSRKQLIFTTHDVQLIDQGLFRRDELWICERAEDGSSELYAITDFKDLRVDKDIQKSYLQGIMGGLPRLLASGAEHNEKFLEPVYPETISCSFISFTNLREVEESPCQTPIKFSLSEIQPC